MTGRILSKKFKTSPVLESLEGRQLLNARMIGPHGKPINDKDYNHFLVQKANNVPVANRRIAYTTPEGSQVELTLFGFGSLAGTTVRPNGTLDIVYSNTTNTSKIVAHIVGGTGYAPLGSIRDAAVAPGSPTAVGSEPINVVNLKKFNLIEGGYINIEGGVGTLALNSASANSQIHIGLLPVTASTGSSNNGVITTSIITTNTGAITNTSGQQVTVTPSNASKITIVPTGPEVSIPIVNAAPRATPIGSAQIYGFDPVANALIRFNAVTGAALQTIPVPTNGSAFAGVGLGRVNGRQVVLVGSGSKVFAYDVISGGSVGSFSIASLAANGLGTIDGIGSSDTRTFVSDSAAGLIQSLDVTASINAGVAVPINAPFAPGREFELSGGVTGLAGSDVIYATGAAHFDTFTPNRSQLGILAFTPSSTGAKESSRVAIPGLTTSTIDAGPPGFLASHPRAALGSIGGSLASVSGVFNGTNVVTLYTSSNTTLTPTGTVNLADGNRLTGLSESFHPELLNAALLDVTGNLRRFTGAKATGLVINASGAINLIQIKSATDTAVIGRPLNHVNIPVRNNVTLLSSARGLKGTGTNGGVTVRAAAKPIGVLSLP